MRGDLSDFFRWLGDGLARVVETDVFFEQVAGVIDGDGLLVDLELIVDVVVKADVREVFD